MKLRFDFSLVRKYGMLLILLLVVGGFALLSDRFFQFSNFIIITRQIAINAVVAAGMTLVILLAGIDLSVGGNIALAGALSAATLVGTGSWVAAVLVGIGVGIAVGAANGFFVSYVGLPPFIVTLATLAMTRGLTLVYTQGQPITISSAPYEFIGSGYVAGIPMPVVVMILVYAAGLFLLTRTVYGRSLYAIGGNETACRMSGLRVNRIKFAAYVLCGALAGLTAIVLTSRLASAQPTAGQSYELDAIAAVILGGTSMSGGQGSILGTIVGALIIGVLSNGLNMLNVSPFYQEVAKGLIILVAVLIDRGMRAVDDSRKTSSMGGRRNEKERVA